jgi:hypothetical protein
MQHVGAVEIAELAATAYSKMPEFPRIDLREVVHRVLHSIEERRDLSPAIQQMLPVMEALGGPEALSSMAEAVLEIRERWV